MTATGTPTDEPLRPMDRLQTAQEWQKGHLTPRQHLHLAYGLTEAQARLLDRIIACESGFQPAIKNPASSASGLAQFLDSTWRTTRRRMGKPDDDLVLKHDPYEHLDTFVWLFRADGTVHWLESARCWGGLSTPR